MIIKNLLCAEKLATVSDDDKKYLAISFIDDNARALATVLIPQELYGDFGELKKMYEIEIREASGA